jgi:hypothetical protein
MVLWRRCGLWFLGRARNPRFYFVHAGTKPPFSDQNGASKIGDSDDHSVLCFGELTLKVKRDA